MHNLGPGGYPRPMLLTCCVSSISDLLVAKGKREPKLALDDLPAYVKNELGLNGVNLTTDLLAGAGRPRIERLRERADKAGCACLLLMEQDALKFGAEDPDKAQAAVDRGRRVLQAASLLGCNAASVAIDAPFLGDDAKDDETVDRVVDHVRMVLERADKLEINLLISPRPGLTQDPTRLTELLKKVGGFRIGTLPDFKAASDWSGDDGDAPSYLRRLTPYASVVLASTFEFAEPGDDEADDKPGSLEDLADMLMSAEPATHSTYDLEPMLEAIGSVGFDGTLAIDYRGGGDGTLGVLQSRDAIEAALETLTD